MKLTHCMNGDTFWIWVTVVLDLSVAVGYILIARHWWRNERSLPPSPAKSALGSLRNIFIFCGICGYIFIPIKMVWPAWRLYDISLCILVYWTWKYALSAQSLKVIYSELGRSKQLEADLEKNKEESRRKSFFLNAISHDLRTPLNALVLQTNLAEMSLKADDPQAAQAALKDIHASARWTADLLDTLLDFARLDWTAHETKISSFPLGALLDNAVANVRANAVAKGLLVSSHCPAGLILHTDRMRVERVVGNLLSNAVKYTKEGSVMVSVDQGRRGVEIHVTDTGPGILPQHQERLFDEFYQVQNVERDRSKGYGLGLATARQLARQLDGDIVVDSAVGRGSRFSLVLPETVIDRGAAPVERPVAAVEVA